MNQDAPGDGFDLEAFQPFLLYLAGLHLDPRLQRKLTAEDLVQDTLMTAHQKRDQCRGHNEAQRKAWLRRILLNTLANALQRLRTQKNNAAREQSLDAALDSSSARLNALLAADHSTPGERAEGNEAAQRLDEALERLPERQQTVVKLKYYHDWKLREIGEHLSLTQTAVVGLLNRGLAKLRDALAGQE